MQVGIPENHHIHTDQKINSLWINNGVTYHWALFNGWTGLDLSDHCRRINRIQYLSIYFLILTCFLAPSCIVNINSRRIDFPSDEYRLLRTSVKWHIYYDNVVLGSYIYWRSLRFYYVYIYRRKSWWCLSPYQVYN